jgi:hypothetical protein
VNGRFHCPRCTVCASGLRLARTRSRIALTWAGGSSSYPIEIAPIGVNCGGTANAERNESIVSMGMPKKHAASPPGREG